MLWGGRAYYPASSCRHARVAESGDQIQQCLDACLRYGIELHP